MKLVRNCKLSEVKYLLAEKCPPASQLITLQIGEVQLWFLLLKLIYTLYKKAQTVHMAGNPPFTPPKWKPLDRGARFTLTLTILSASPAPTVLGNETQRICLPLTLPWLVGFSENWRKNGKEVVCGFLPAFLLSVWEHYPLSCYLLHFFGHLFPTEITIWDDCKDSRGETCVKQKRKSEQCFQPKEVKVKMPQWQV